MSFDPHHPDGSALTRAEIDELPADAVYFCDECQEPWEGLFCPTCHVGVCGICSAPVPKGQARYDHPPHDPYCEPCYLQGEGEACLALPLDLPVVRLMVLRETHLGWWTVIVGALIAIGYSAARMISALIGGGQ